MIEEINIREVLLNSNFSEDLINKLTQDEIENLYNEYNQISSGYAQKIIDETEYNKALKELVKTLTARYNGDNMDDEELERAATPQKKLKTGSSIESNKEALNISNNMLEEITEKTPEEEKDLFQILEEKNIKVSDAQKMLRMALSGKYSIKNLNKYLKLVKTLEAKKEELKKKGEYLDKKDQIKLCQNKDYYNKQNEVKEFLELLATNNIAYEDIESKILPFADPTFDITFKVLFGSNQHTDILISLLNSVLELKDKDAIKTVTFTSGSFNISQYSNQKGETGIKSEVDVLCTTNGHKTIAIEMQRANQPYFLARMQHYMSKLIEAQGKAKDASAYHTVIDKTYILVFAKENLFVGQRALTPQLNKGTQTKLDEVLVEEIQRIDYEIDADIRLLQTGQQMPDNKMYWKFFELSRFIEHDDSKDLDKNSDIKHQWLEFLINCGNAMTILTRHELITKGYKIMKTLKHEALSRALYWKEQQSYITAEEQKEMGFEEGLEQGKLEGLEQGKLKGEIKGEINKLKDFLDMEIQKEKYQSKFTHLTLDNLQHIQEHQDDDVSLLAEQIMQDTDFTI